MFKAVEKIYFQIFWRKKANKYKTKTKTGGKKTIPEFKGKKELDTAVLNVFFFQPVLLVVILCNSVLLWAQKI